MYTSNKGMGHCKRVIMTSWDYKPLLLETSSSLSLAYCSSFASSSYIAGMMMMVVGIGMPSMTRFRHGPVP
jgi:hypothetical protein